MNEHEPHPEMTEGLLDDEQCAALFRDYRECVQVDEIIVKAGPGYVEERGQQPTLDETRLLLESRTVRGVQVRYRYDNAHWLDTLMPTPDGVRIIRVRHELEG